MAVIAFPRTPSAPQANWLGHACLHYVNWRYRSRGSRFINLRIGILSGCQEARPVREFSGEAISGFEIHEMSRVGGVRRLVRLFNEAYIGAPDYQRAGWIQAMALQASRSFDPSLVWIACVDGEPVGFCMARMVEGVGRITGLGVRPSHRRRGIGTLLMQNAFEQLRWRGAGNAILSVAEGNENSLQFYEALGMKPFTP